MKIAVQKHKIVRIVRQGRACLSFHTGSVRNRRSAWPYKGPLIAKLLTLATWRKVSRSSRELPGFRLLLPVVLPESNFDLRLQMQESGQTIAG